MATEPILLSVKDTCTALSIGRTKLYELLDTNRLEAVRIGGKRLVKAASVRAFADSLSGVA